MDKSKRVTVSIWQETYALIASEMVRIHREEPHREPNRSEIIDNLIREALAVRKKS
jgi:hypothetical protein